MYLQSKFKCRFILSFELTYIYVTILVHTVFWKWTTQEPSISHGGHYLYQRFKRRYLNDFLVKKGLHVTCIINKNSVKLYFLPKTWNTKYVKHLIIMYIEVTFILLAHCKTDVTCRSFVHLKKLVLSFPCLYRGS